MESNGATDGTRGGLTDGEISTSNGNNNIPNANDNAAATNNHLVHDSDDMAAVASIASPIPRKYYREMRHRIFVNRSLHLEKIKFFGFDMDYTLAEYCTPAYEAMTFELAIERLIILGYPEEFREFVYDPEFPVRGLWFDKLHGNLLKVDPYGNILVCVHGFKFLKTSEIYEKYPNKFVQMDESRIQILNTLFDLPETYMFACVVDYFSHKYSLVEEGVEKSDAKLFMPFKSISQDVRQAFDHIHSDGSLKKKTIDNIEKYVKRHDELPKLFNQMRKNGKKTFLLTNSDYYYTDKIMSYLFNVESADKKHWTSFFDFIVVDARKPLFFGEGTILRQVDTRTGALKIDISKTVGRVFSGGNCDVFTQLIGAKGRDVLYVGDHIYGDILKSKKTRGWRTFLVVPELERELHVWTSEREIYDKLTELDISLADAYKGMDSTSSIKPDLSELKIKIRETIHKLDMSYGKLGSIFRCGSRQTHFANQLTRYADLYACTFLNLQYYPFSYLFRAPPTLMPHESTVTHQSKFAYKSQSASISKNSLDSPLTEVPQGPSATAAMHRQQSLVPHLYAEKPTEVTHHHDTDEEDSEEHDTHE